MNTANRKRRAMRKHIDRLVVRVTSCWCDVFVPTCPQCQISLQAQRSFGKRFAIARETYDWVNS